MKGIIFVVWEKYLAERFGSSFVEKYRNTIGKATYQFPATDRVYPDLLLIQGLQTASQLSMVQEDRLMFEYGHYFMLNGLVEYLCGYLLAQSWNAADLLLQMRGAHAQMRRTADGVEPPLFMYEVLSADHSHMILTYDSERKLCSLLNGCIYGAAERFGEKVETYEHICMKRGHAVCKFEVRFAGESWAKRATPVVIEQEKQRLSRQGLGNLLLQVLSPDERASMTFSELHRAIKQNQGAYFPDIYKQQPSLSNVHVSQIYSALARLQQVGLVASTINRSDDTFAKRRYWRAPVHD